MYVPAASGRSTTFVPSLEDALAAYRLKTQPRIWAVVLGAIVVSTFITVLSELSGATAESLVVAVPAGVAVYTLLLALNRRFVLSWWVRKIYRQQAGLRKEVTLTWNDERFQAKSDAGSSTTSWGDYAGRRENDEVILLYHSDALFQFVPRRVLTDAQHADLANCVAGVPLKR